MTRLLVAKDLFTVADAEVAELCRTFLARAGAARLPRPRRSIAAPDGFEEWGEAFRILQASEVWETFGAFVTRAKPALGPGIKERIAVRRDRHGSAGGRCAPRSSAAARAHVRALVPPGTVVALPTSPSIAPQARSRQPRRWMRSGCRVMRLTSLAGLGGLPQVTIPAGTVAGCPVGFSLMGWAGGDEALLDLACELARWCGVVR